MSADERATRVLRALLAEIDADRRTLDAHRAAVEDALGGAPWPGSAPVLSVVALALHHYYSGVEAIFERVARRFEGLPEGDRWHAELPRAMQLDIDGVRPALIPARLAPDLGQLLGFRHFLRHAHAVALDPRRLEDTARALVRVDPGLSAALDAFVAGLRAELAR